jgi:hypothetical protein
LREFLNSPRIGNPEAGGGKVIGPDERLTPLEALKAITLWGAY